MWFGGLALLGLAVWIAVDYLRVTLALRRARIVDRLPTGQFSRESVGLLLQLAKRRFGDSGCKSLFGDSPDSPPPYRLQDVFTMTGGDVLAFFTHGGPDRECRLAVSIENDADVAELFARVSGQPVVLFEDDN